jgi:DNA-binding transcriptional ArsR family regulator
MTPISEVNVFRALGDPTRLRILKLLTGGELCVCQIEQALCISQALTSRHLGILRMTGLVQARREGQWVHYSLAKPATAFERLIRECIRKTLQQVAEPASNSRACPPFSVKQLNQTRLLEKSSRSKNGR